MQKISEFPEVIYTPPQSLNFLNNDQQTTSPGNVLLSMKQSKLPKESVINLAGDIIAGGMSLKEACQKLDDR